MPKRDYKSYNVLAEELAQEDVSDEIEAVEIIKEKSANLIEEYPSDRVEIQEEHKLLESVQVIQEPKKEKLKETEISHKKISLGKQLGKARANEGEQGLNEPKETNKEVESSQRNIRIGDPLSKQESAEDYKSHDEDMSFSAYKTYYQTKERSRLVKWSMRLVKFIIVLMLLPLLTILGGSVLAVLGGAILGIVVIIGTGFVILGAVCFVSTQINASIMALGIAAAITALALGGILLILFIMIMKWIIGLVNKYRRPRKSSMKKEAK